MLNILPRVTGLSVAPHLKISYSAALDLAGGSVCRPILTHQVPIGDTYGIHQ